MNEFDGGMNLGIRDGMGYLYSTPMYTLIPLMKLLIDL